MNAQILTYDELAAIPLRIQEERIEIKQRPASSVKWGYYSAAGNRAAAAQLAVMGFMMEWLLVLPWLSRNLCECRISGSKMNLFCEMVKPNEYLPLPSWAVKIFEKQPLWQYRFESNETSNGAYVHAVLPKNLIKPLETYLEARKTLVGELPTETLFVNERGDRYEQKSAISDHRNDADRAQAPCHRRLSATSLLTSTFIGAQMISRTSRFCYGIGGSRVRKKCTSFRIDPMASLFCSAPGPTVRA